jgi:hypothetical protein
MAAQSGGYKHENESSPFLVLLQLFQQSLAQIIIQAAKTTALDYFNMITSRRGEP